jgi:hypothetical protein
MLQAANGATVAVVCVVRHVSVADAISQSFKSVLQQKHFSSGLCPFFILQIGRVYSSSALSALHISPLTIFFWFPQSHILTAALLPSFAAQDIGNSAFPL